MDGFDVKEHLKVIRFIWLIFCWFFQYLIWFNCWFLIYFQKSEKRCDTIKLVSLMKCLTNFFESNRTKTLPHASLSINLYSHLDTLSLNECFIEKITDESLRNLINLKILSLENNRITSVEDFSFYDLKNLVRLNLKSNQISFIYKNTFKGLFSLKELNLSSNRIESIEAESFKDFSKLEIMIVDNNRLKQLDDNLFDIIPLINDSNDPNQMLYLNLSFNNLKIIPKSILSSLLNLKSLDLSNNELESIDFISHIGEHHQSATCSSNQQRQQQQQNATTTTNSNIYHNHLESIKLNKNRIRSLDRNQFSKSNQVISIDLSGNQLKEFYIESVNGLNQLVELNLSDNNLKRIKYVDAESMRRVIRSLKRLKLVNLKSNRMMRLVNSRSTLKNVYILQYLKYRTKCHILTWEIKKTIKKKLSYLR